MKQFAGRKAAPIDASPAPAPARCSTDPTLRPTHGCKLTTTPKSTSTGPKVPAHPSQMGLLTCREPLPAETSVSLQPSVQEEKGGCLCYRAAQRASLSSQLQLQREIHFPAPSGPTSSVAWGNSCLFSPACANAHTDAPFPDIM